MCSPYSKPPINIAQVILSPDFHGFPSQPTKQHSNSRYGHCVIILHTFPRPPVVRLKARGHNMKLLLLLVKSKFIFCVVLYVLNSVCTCTRLPCWCWWTRWGQAPRRSAGEAAAPRPAATEVTTAGRRRRATTTTSWTTFSRSRWPAGSGWPGASHCPSS